MPQIDFLHSAMLLTPRWQTSAPPYRALAQKRHKKSVGSLDNLICCAAAGGRRFWGLKNGVKERRKDWCIVAGTLIVSVRTLWNGRNDLRSSGNALIGSRWRGGRLHAYIIE